MEDTTGHMIPIWHLPLGHEDELEWRGERNDEYTFKKHIVFRLLMYCDQHRDTHLKWHGMDWTVGWFLLSFPLMYRISHFRFIDIPVGLNDKREWSITALNGKIDSPQGLWMPVLLTQDYHIYPFLFNPSNVTLFHIQCGVGGWMLVHETLIFQMWMGRQQVIINTISMRRDALIVLCFLSGILQTNHQLWDL